MPCISIKDTKLQTFQYKILNHILPCQSKLFNWKIADNYSCKYCGEYDSLSHYLYTCSISTFFFNQLNNWLWTSVKARIPLSKGDIIFGIKNTDNLLLNNLNVLILYGKWYIHRRKIENKDLFFLDYLNDVKQNLIIEKQRFSLKGEKDAFDKKWSNFKDVLLDT